MQSTQVLGVPNYGELAPVGVPVNLVFALTGVSNDRSHNRSPVIGRVLHKVGSAVTREQGPPKRLSVGPFGALGRHRPLEALLHTPHDVCYTSLDNIAVWNWQATRLPIFGPSCLPSGSGRGI